jgi:hypothetical protein
MYTARFGAASGLSQEAPPREHPDRENSRKFHDAHEQAVERHDSPANDPGKTTVASEDSRL